MIINIISAPKKRVLVPPPESYYAFRHRYLAGLGAACPAGTVVQGDKCCIPQSEWDGMDKRCILNSNYPQIVTTQNGKHLKQGSAPPPGGGGGGGGPCISNCANRVCGDNGCGGSCGTCNPGLECQNGSCVPDTSGGGGSSTGGGSTAGGSGGGGVILGGGGGSSFDPTALLESPLVWIGGGLLLVAVAYRIIRKPPAASSGVTVVR